MSDPSPRFEIVRRKVRPKYWWPAVVAVPWLISIVLTWGIASWQAAPNLGTLRTELQAAEQEVAVQRRQISELQQQESTLQYSDQISRAANKEVQSSLAEREEEIAALRADVAFYERLVGSTQQRKELSVHSVEFTPEAAGTWQYAMVLTQTLNRGAISQGQMRFMVEGVHDGQLTSVSWTALHQQETLLGQEYSFRYFQRLNGSVILPKDFTPQRVKVSLSGGGVNVNQTFDWKPVEISRTE